MSVPSDPRPSVGSDEFLAIVSRELRHPLAPLHTSLETLRLRSARDEASLNALATMDRQLGRLAQMVDDLIDLSRFALGRSKLRPLRIELADVLRGAVEASRPALGEAGHALAVDVDWPQLGLNADPIRLTHAFEVLLEHAIRSTERGGRIELSARRDGGQAVVTVRDSGPGIPADALPRIFELDPGARDGRPHPPGGLGVGLTVVRSLVELHGGTVEARSEGPGRGSEFEVRLPLAAPSTAPAAAPSRAGAAGSVSTGTSHSTSRSSRPGRLRVLVVDDNLDAADSLGTLLEVLGEDVRVAYDGHSALDVAAGFRPHLVLLDLSMPSLDGFEVARRLRARPEGKPALLVALTALDREADRRNSWAAGFDSHLVKPVDIGVLRAMLFSLEAEVDPPSSVAPHVASETEAEASGA